MAEHMEIERKFLVEKLPEGYESRFPSHIIEQGYLCIEPVVRIRRQDDKYFLTYKGQGLLAREEYNHPLSESAYNTLRTKCEGELITKTRYKIPYGIFTIEMDIFEGQFSGLTLAEVEFDDEEEAKNFVVPEWFGDEVTYDPSYYNSNMSMRSIRGKEEK